jgi:GntR family transcriptional regulator/MocR family aminotransferase
MPTDKARHPALTRTLYEEFCNRIADGTFAAGAALPSTRALAAERGLSRTTVTLVYEQLAAEGFIETRTGAPSRVAHGAADPAPHVSGAGRKPKGLAGSLSTIGERMAALTVPPARPVGVNDIDFVYGPLAGSDFPTLAWMKALRGAERQRPGRLEYDDPRGSLRLRKALQAHLSKTRGLVCSVEQLMVVNGSQQALDLCARLLVEPGASVVVENPGYRMAHHAFEAYGARLQPVDVDEHGLMTGQLAALGPAQLAYVTPTHQFPLGGFMPIARRRQLLEWAAASRAWVIEDDYDSEYRYAVRPEATLLSLDSRGCVIHVGTFSKTLSPQLRLGYMVLPPTLVDAFTAAKRVTDRHAANGAQQALATLLEDGTYDRHVRRIRRLQHARQRTLTEALERRFGEEVTVQGTASGLHVVAWLPSLSQQAEPAVVEAARRRGVCVHPIGPLFVPRGKGTGVQRPCGLVMGYALLDAAQIAKGVVALSKAVQEVRTQS